eukprot:TRINITY_DN50870_c0_g1_i1.p1 TRINITY_DN50870_c0_g1~~TRINITY_DN50870_c0_g1_i1.p1  ORF type:complete len:248 (+),score=28.19 TRINITY_DN50870_c0_g1_i1:108-851(+)
MVYIYGKVLQQSQLVGCQIKIRKILRGQRNLINFRNIVSSASTQVEKKGNKNQSVQGDGTWLIAGLGNPGPTYDKTRHNVGFMVVDALAKKYGISMKKLEKSAAVGRGVIKGCKVLLAKPMTFMNNSGESISQLAKYYKIPQGQVLAVYDDLDLNVAEVLFRMRVGTGGHNGMKSITKHFAGSQDFPRIKIGIGRPTGNKQVVTYVLQEFSKQELEEIQFAIVECCEIIEATCGLGLQEALSGLRCQ